MIHQRAISQKKKKRKKKKKKKKDSPKSWLKQRPRHISDDKPADQSPPTTTFRSAIQRPGVALWQAEQQGMALLAVVKSVGHLGFAGFAQCCFFHSSTNVIQFGGASTAKV
ncbi:unnamed protein product [Urochloa humidicola]